MVEEEEDMVEDFTNPPEEVFERWGGSFNLGRSTVGVLWWLVQWELGRAQKEFTEQGLLTEADIFKGTYHLSLNL